MGGHSYYALISSLPALPPRFDVERCPITWPRLQDRLRGLTPEDAANAALLFDFLAWDRQPIDRTDDDVTVLYQHVMAQLTNPFARELVTERIDNRTILAALRRRRLGWGPPSGASQWVDSIRRRWSHPQFGLQARFPWIAELDRLLADDDTLGIERQIVALAWTSWSRLAGLHHFTFEAVLLYVARWSVLNRWVSQDIPSGRQRFQHSLSQLLKDHVRLDS
jgi:hypothetical protein